MSKQPDPKTNASMIQTHIEEDKIQSSSIATNVQPSLHRTNQSNQENMTNMDSFFSEDVTAKAPPFFSQNKVIGFLVSGFLLWGSTFLWIKKPLIASLFLFTLMVTFVLFLAVNSLLPVFMANFILEILQWPFPLGPSVMGIGFLLIVLWWISVVFPVMLSNFHPLIPTQNAPILLICSPLPLIGQCIRGKLWQAYANGFAWIAFPVSIISVIRIWSAAPNFPTTDASQSEPYFIVLLGLMLLSGIVIILGFIQNFLDFLRALGWLSSMDDPEGTQWLFVILGFFVIAGFCFYVLLGPIGQMIQDFFHTGETYFQQRNFFILKNIAHTVRLTWQQMIQSVQDQMQLMQ